MRRYLIAEARAWLESGLTVQFNSVWLVVVIASKRNGLRKCPILYLKPRSVGASSESFTSLPVSLSRASDVGPRRLEGGKSMGEGDDVAHKCLAAVSLARRVGAARTDHTMADNGGDIEQKRGGIQTSKTPLVSLSPSSAVGRTGCGQAEGLRAGGFARCLAPCSLALPQDAVDAPRAKIPCRRPSWCFESKTLSF